MTAQSRPSKPTPSAYAIERRIGKAERQRNFAARAGWPDVAVLYGRLAADLRAMLPAELVERGVLTALAPARLAPDGTAEKAPRPILITAVGGACDYPWRCLACPGAHGPGTACGALRDGWWSLVKDRTDGRAYRWARTRLALDDDPETAPVRPSPASHHCGWAEVDGEWRCVQDDDFAVGVGPETGCGATWEPVR